MGKNINKIKSNNLIKQHKKNCKDFIWKTVVFFWFFFISGLLGVFVIFYATYQGWFGPIPNIKDFDNPDKFVPSQIISDDGVVLDKFEKQLMIPVEYKDFPPFLVEALLAKEDKRFFEHTGIDLESILRVVYYRGKKGGGSTITQQLAKNLFTIQSKEELEEHGERKKSWFEEKREFQKLREWLISIELEKRYTKQEIIRMYFNKFDYLNNAIGVEMASRVYYQKNVKDLNLNEVATLVGMFENPNRYNPIFNSRSAKLQRNLVLRLMKEQGKISKIQYYETIQQPIIVNFKRVEKTNKNFSAYFKHQLRKDVLMYLNEYAKKTGKKYNLYKDGLKIYVTIDSRMQQYAEEAIKEHLTKLQRIFFEEIQGKKTAPFSGISIERANELFYIAMKRTRRYELYKSRGMSEEQIINEFKKPIRLEIFTWKGASYKLMSPWDSIRYHKHIINSGLMAMEPSTGNIKAWVGGIDWNYFQYDHVKQARRQVGSTFKPFVYASLMAHNGYTPCSMISNSVPRSLGWSPKGSGEGATTIKNAIAKSLNGCAVNAMNIAGVNNTINLCRDLGIESKIEPNLTSALGSCDLTIYEMVGAYSTFANYGTYTRPEMIWRIENMNGTIIKEYVSEQKEVLNELHAYSMIEAMQGVTLEGGTGKAARNYINTQIAGKTGTTNKNSDAWFMGMTPKLACGVWVGWEDRDTHFNSRLGQGSKSALPIWGIFMKKVYSNSKLGYSLQDKFTPPTSSDVFDCESLKEIGRYGESYGTIDDFEYEKTNDDVERDALVDKSNSSDSTKSRDLNATINRRDEDLKLDD